VLELQSVGKRFQVAGREVTALADLSVTLEQGSFTTVVGRSGCGKTTLLRILAGLEQPTEGAIVRPQTAPQSVGVVFQDARLMPWLDVFENVAFGLRRRLPKNEINVRCTSILEMMGLLAFVNAMPSQLSGGMAQRVAIARAMVLEPRYLLLDEPFAALDAFTRRSMQNELVAIWLQRQPTVVFVTHDVEEAVLLGQQVLELDRGRLVGRDRVALNYPRDPMDTTIMTHLRDILQRLHGLPRQNEPIPGPIAQSAEI
jgi:ABC-type nitrate/sulfonate/bicarbonate transport system ATPase subunit